MARNRRRIFVGARLLSIPLPGSGHVLGGRAPLGLLLLITWGTSWIGMLQRGRAIVSPEAIAPASLSESILPLITLAFVTWLWGNFTSHESVAG